MFLLKETTKARLWLLAVEPPSALAKDRSAVGKEVSQSWSVLMEKQKQHL